MSELNYCGLCEHLVDKLNYFYCPIIKKEVHYTGKVCDEFIKKNKVELDDIIGLIKTPNPTDSVTLKKSQYFEDRFVYVKPKIGFAKGTIHDNDTGYDYEETTDSLLDLINSLNFENFNNKNILKDYMDLLNKIQLIIPSDSNFNDLNQEDYENLLRLCNVGRELLYMSDYNNED